MKGSRCLLISIIFAIAALAVFSAGGVFADDNSGGAPKSSPPSPCEAVSSDDGSIIVIVDKTATPKIIKLISCLFKESNPVSGPITSNTSPSGQIGVALSRVVGASCPSVSGATTGGSESDDDDDSGDKSKKEGGDKDKKERKGKDNGKGNQGEGSGKAPSRSRRFAPSAAPPSGLSPDQLDIVVTSICALSDYLPKKDVPGFLIEIVELVSSGQFPPSIGGDSGSSGGSCGSGNSGNGAGSGNGGSSSSSGSNPISKLCSGPDASSQKCVQVPGLGKNFYINPSAVCQVFNSGSSSNGGASPLPGVQLTQPQGTSSLTGSALPAVGGVGGVLPGSITGQLPPPLSGGSPVPAQSAAIAKLTPDSQPCKDLLTALGQGCSSSTGASGSSSAPSSSMPVGGANTASADSSVLQAILDLVKQLVGAVQNILKSLGLASVDPTGKLPLSPGDIQNLNALIKQCFPQPPLTPGAGSPISVPAIPGAPSLPGTPSLPGAPSLPGTPSLPELIPGIPGSSAPAPPTSGSGTPVAK